MSKNQTEDAEGRRNLESDPQPISGLLNTCIASSLLCFKTQSTIKIIFEILFYSHFVSPCYHFLGTVFSLCFEFHCHSAKIFELFHAISSFSPLHWSIPVENDTHQDFLFSPQKHLSEQRTFLLNTVCLNSHFSSRTEKGNSLRISRSYWLGN